MDVRSEAVLRLAQLRIAICLLLVAAPSARADDADPWGWTRAAQEKACPWSPQPADAHEECGTEGQHQGYRIKFDLISAHWQRIQNDTWLCSAENRQENTGLNSQTTEMIQYFDAIALGSTHGSAHRDLPVWHLR